MKVSILDMVDGSDGGEGLSSCQSTSGGSFGEKIGCVDRPCHMNRVRMVAAKCIRGERRRNISRRKVYDLCVPQSQMESRSGGSAEIGSEFILNTRLGQDPT